MTGHLRYIEYADYSIQVLTYSRYIVHQEELDLSPLPPEGYFVNSPDHLILLCGMYVVTIC